MAYWPHSNPEAPPRQRRVDPVAASKRASRARARLTSTIGKPSHREHPRCQKCQDNEVRDNATICHDCTAKFRRQLALIPVLLDAVNSAYAGQVRMAERTSASRSAETSLPYNDSPVLAAEALTRTLAQWVRTFKPDWVAFVEPTPAASLALWLREHTRTIRRHDDAVNVIESIEHQMNALARTLDRQPDRWFAGPCGQQAWIYDEPTDTLTVGECPADLYGYGSPQNPTSIHCRSCGADIDPATRRAYLVDVSADIAARAADISRALTRFGAPVTKTMITRWKTAGQLEPCAQTIAGRHDLYRLGEVQQLLVDHLEAQARRDAKRDAKQAAAERATSEGAA